MKKRIYSIDVLKLVFAYIIAFFHFGTTIAPGPTVAVQVFFIISGFFLGKKFYARSFADGGKSYSAWDYTLDHVTSIYPHYLFSLAAFFLYTLARSLVHLAMSPSWTRSALSLWTFTTRSPTSCSCKALTASTKVSTIPCGSCPRW